MSFKEFMNTKSNHRVQPRVVRFGTDTVPFAVEVFQVESRVGDDWRTVRTLTKEDSASRFVDLLNLAFPDKYRYTRKEVTYQASAPKAKKQSAVWIEDTRTVNDLLESLDYLEPSFQKNSLQLLGIVLGSHVVIE